jgi:hypothetical protein
MPAQLLLAFSLAKEELLFKIADPASWNCFLSNFITVYEFSVNSNFA